MEKDKKKKLTSVEMKFFRRRAGCTLFEHNRNEEIFEKLEVELVEDKLRRLKPFCYDM
jgi:hypothetical protein